MILRFQPVYLVSMVVVTVDGSCHERSERNLCSVGIFWGVEDIRNRSYRIDYQTNNQAELMAVYIALCQVKQLGYDTVRIETDSRYVKNIFDKWLNNWKANGWRCANRRPVKNRELIERIDRIKAGITTEFTWVSSSTDGANRIMAAHNLAQRAIYDEKAIVFDFDCS